MKLGNDAEPTRAEWRKSSRSGGGNQCVEVAEVGAMRAIRDSKSPKAGRLTVDVDTFKRFVVSVKQGDYDL